MFDKYAHANIAIYIKITEIGDKEDPIVFLKLKTITEAMIPRIIVPMKNTNWFREKNPIIIPPITIKGSKQKTDNAPIIRPICPLLVMIPKDINVISDPKKNKCGRRFFKYSSL